MGGPHIINASVGLEGAGNAPLGEVLPLLSILPFAGMLLSIALFPLFAPKFWHNHFGKVSAFWSAVIAVPFLIAYRGAALHEFLHVVAADYIPFMILLWSLYTISGNILLKGRLRGTPAVNAGMLTVGTVLASWMGTTGASMLLIRPFIRANSHRKNRAFMIVFFIFLVSNVGGALTPLGDPPLFLGFLRGVPFFWTFKLLPHMLLTYAVLMAVYLVIDTYYYRKEGRPGPPNAPAGIRLEGGYNFLFLLGVIGSVLLSAMVKWKGVSVLGVHIGLQDMTREAVMVLMGLFSLALTPRRIREENQFTWFPIKEIAIIFIGIFITMVPCLKILQAGSKGGLGFLMEAVKEPYHYFWVTGVLSSFLDNAPTYLTFLNTALGGFYAGVPSSVAIVNLINENHLYLEAVSAGAVLFGALSYIGNAPNFMVRSIAEEAGISMPSFFGFMIKYSLVVLLPVFALISLIFFSP